MLQEAIKLLQAQSDRFHRMVEKEPTNAKLQAQYWQLISENEEIIAKLKAFSLNNRDGKPKPIKSYNANAKSVSRQQAIYNIIEANGGEAHISRIEDAFQLLEEHKGVTQPIIRYNVGILVDDGRVINTSYGNYAINKSSNNEP